MEVARSRERVQRHNAARSSRPPSSGTPGIRLNAPTGVQDVRDQLRLNPAAASRNTRVIDNELSKRVAQKIAGAIPGAKAGEDLGATGWRVEGPGNRWRVVIDNEERGVALDGEVPRLGIIRDVQSVRSDIALEGSASVYDPNSGCPVYGSDPYGYAYWARQSAAGPTDVKASDKAASATAKNAHGFRGLHTMTGEVTKIDQNQGTLTLQTPEATMDLHFPPSALSGLDRGDRITVDGPDVRGRRLWAIAQRSGALGRRPGV